MQREKEKKKKSLLHPQIYEIREQFAIDGKMKYDQFLKFKETEEEYETSNCEKTLSAGLGSGIVFNFVSPICFLVFYSLLFLAQISSLCGSGH